MIRLFTPEKIYANARISIDPDQRHYLKNVMRKKIWDKIHIFNGVNGLWESEIADGWKVLAIKLLQEQCAEKRRITLLFSPIKRQNFVIEKATEIGATEIVPVLCDSTVVRKFSIERAIKIATQACEQCGRISIPKIYPLLPLEKAIDMHKTQNLIFCDVLGEPIAHLVQKGAPHGFIIGPEGGFVKQEKELIESVARAASLGINILRAETAALCAISVASALIE